MTRTPTHVLVTMLDVEIDFVSDLGALGGLDRLRAKECRNRDEDNPEYKPAEHGSRE